MIGSHDSFDGGKDVDEAAFAEKLFAIAVASPSRCEVNTDTQSGKTALDILPNSTQFTAIAAASFF